MGTMCSIAQRTWFNRKVEDFVNDPVNKTRNRKALLTALIASDKKASKVKNNVAAKAAAKRAKAKSAAANKSLKHNNAAVQRTLFRPNQKAVIPPVITPALFAANVLNKSNKKHLKMAQHLDTHWFGAKNNLPLAWWPDHPEAEDVCSRALMLFLVDPNYQDLDLQMLWICSGDYFQYTLFVSDHQLTFINVTPPIPGGQMLGSSVHKEPIKVIASKENGEYCRNSAMRHGGRDPIEPGTETREIWVMDCFSEDDTGT